MHTIPPNRGPVGCDISLLTLSNIGSIEPIARSHEFGSEQAILVKNDETKSRLRAQLGQNGIILTILQSKGMEFDDVILFNFFTDSPFPSVVRSLSSLLLEGSIGFDSKKFPGICCELKSLYVAATRARSQLFLVEGSENATAPVVKLFTQDVPRPLIEVTSPGTADFEMYKAALRPGLSSDPLRWSVRGQKFMQLPDYQEALMCFQKAGDERGEMEAQARIHEEDGRRCNAAGDNEGCRQNLEAAVTLFIELNLFIDAASNLTRMEEFVRAAELWTSRREYKKAAGLFLRAKKYIEASKYYHLGSLYEAAAAALRDGGNFDQLVLYLAK